jgi:hypothetical protein
MEETTFRGAQTGQFRHLGGIGIVVAALQSPDGTRAAPSVVDVHTHW